MIPVGSPVGAPIPVAIVVVWVNEVIVSLTQYIGVGMEETEEVFVYPFIVLEVAAAVEPHPFASCQLTETDLLPEVSHLITNELLPLPPEVIV